MFNLKVDLKYFVKDIWEYIIKIFKRRKTKLVKIYGCFFLMASINFLPCL